MRSVSSGLNVPTCAEAKCQKQHSVPAGRIGWQQRGRLTAIEIAQEPASMLRLSSFRCLASVAEFGAPPRRTSSAPMVADAALRTSYRSSQLESCYMRLL